MPATIKHLTCVLGPLMVMGLSAASSELSCECDVIDSLNVCRLNQVRQRITWHADNLTIKDEFENVLLSMAEDCRENCIKVKNLHSVITVRDVTMNEEVQCIVKMGSVNFRTKDPGKNTASKTGFDVLFVVLIILIFFII